MNTIVVVVDTPDTPRTVVIRGRPMNVRNGDGIEVGHVGGVVGFNIDDVVVIEK